MAAYLGNPNVHTMAGPLYLKPLLKAIGTKNIFSASTVDQMPKHVSAGFMFGGPLVIPVPDLDRGHLAAEQERLDLGRAGEGRGRGRRHGGNERQQSGGQ